MNTYLQTKIDENVKQALDNDELKDAYRCLESNLSQEDKAFKERAVLLERNVEQISTLYHVSTFIFLIIFRTLFKPDSSWK